MTRYRALVSLTALGLFLQVVPAEEPPHREFVQGLRDRHYTDLALQYLEQLGKNPNPDLAKWLPLELAKTRMELAREEADPGRRSELFAKARAEFENFIKANPTDPRVAEANLELARSVGLQGKAQLAQALRQESPENRQAENVKA